MNPAEELALLRHRLLGMLTVQATDVLRASEDGKPKMYSNFAVILAQFMADADKLHTAYADFARRQVEAEQAKHKTKPPEGKK